MTMSRAQFLPSAFDQTVPENQSKVEAVEQLNALADEAGMSLALFAHSSHPGMIRGIRRAGLGIDGLDDPQGLQRLASVNPEVLTR